MSTSSTEGGRVGYGLAGLPIDLPPDHGEAVIAGEVCGARQSRHRLLAGVDQVRVHLEKD